MSQAPAACRYFQRAVVDIPDQLCGDEYRDAELIAREPPQLPEYLIGPIMTFALEAMIVHEGSQQCGMLLLLANEQLGDSNELGCRVRERECARRSHQCLAFRLLAELKGRERFGNRALFFGCEHVGHRLRHTALELSVILEMIQPDSEVWEHGDD